MSSDHTSSPDIAASADPEEVLTDEEKERLLQEVEKRRTLTGPVVLLVSLIGITFSAFQMWIAARSYTFYLAVPLTDLQYTITSLQQLQVNAIHVAFALVLSFLLFPSTTGEGPLSRRCARIVPAARERFGTDSPLAAGLARVRGGVRWAALDPGRDRITPVDVGMIGFSLLIPLYMIQEFDEIRGMRARGLAAGRSIDEVYPLLDLPVSLLVAVGIPLDEVSYAFLLGAVGILLVMEATRRVLSLFLMILVGLFVAYARFGYLLPTDVAVIGSLAIPNLTWASIISALWYTDQGVFGIPVTVSVRFIYIFILFGAFLEMSGAGKWFIDLAYSLTGTRRGGPAKASVVSSGFMGMLSGSSVANTVTTGAFTIPLMKRSGYSPEFSGAVESSTSSGGQILPPVMGAAAFLIVEYTGTPFREVIIAATLPAIAFFVGMWVMVHLEAGRQDIGGLDRSELGSIPGYLKVGWFYLVPVLLLLYYLVIARLSVGRAGWLTIVAVVALIAFIAAYEDATRIPLVGGILAVFLANTAAFAIAGVSLAGVVSGAAGETLSIAEAIRASLGTLDVVVLIVSLLFVALRPRGDAPLLELDPSVGEAATRAEELTGRSFATTKPGTFLTFVLRSMDSGARTATTVVIAVAAAGVIPGVIAVSGLGPNLAALIEAVSGGSFIVLLLLTGISAVILGMGMPTTVMYIILVAMLGGPIAEFGIAILAAHLFILYFGLMADVTPPVAVAAFAAAGVAKADEFATAIIAFMLSLNKILVPFAFVFSPGILLLRPTEEGYRIITAADVADVGFFVPEVAIPIVGMFVGVYAMGVGIIGYYQDEVTTPQRVLFGLSSVAMMAPALFLLSAQGIGRWAGIWLILDQPMFDLGLRAVGLVLLVALLVVNRRETGEAEPQPTAASATR